MTPDQRITELEQEISLLRFTIDTYHNQHNPLLLEVSRLREALARSAQAA